MKRLGGWLLSLVTIGVCLALAEIALTLFAPVPDPFEHLKHTRLTRNQYIRSVFAPGFRFVTEAEEGLPGMQGQSVFTTNNKGFRGDSLITPKPSDEYRIFMIGGSTTECFYLDDSVAINSVLQRELNARTHGRLRVKVYNAGKSGDASDDHISMLVHRIAHLEPDMVILLCGLNDITRAIYDYDYQHFVKKQLPNTWDFWKFTATEFQIPRRLHYLRRSWAPSEEEILEGITAKTNYREKVALRKSVAPSDARPRLDLEAYERNLHTLIGIAQAQGIKLVLMMQVSSWNSAIDSEIREWHWMLYRNGVTYTEEAMDLALEEMNDVMRILATEYGVPLFDLPRYIPKSSEYLYDDVHFNVKGAETAARELTAFIVTRGLIR